MSYTNSHFADLIYHQAEKYGQRQELLYRDDKKGNWKSVSWNRFAEKVRLTSQAMIEYGIGVQENIGIYAQNMPQCFYTNFGAFGIRAAEVSMYATSSPEQIRYIIEDANIHLLFVGEQLQYNNAWKVKKETGDILKQLVIFDNNVVRHPGDNTSVYFDEFIRLGDNAHAETNVKIRRHEAHKSDIAMILYTSGTTGESKGVIITHENMFEVLRIHDIRLPMISDRDISMCFLPLTHIFEKAWSCLCISQGISVAINHDPKKIQQILPEIRPTLMCNVPRFWEKVYAGVQEKIENAPGLLKKILKNAAETGRRYVLEYKNRSIRAPFGLALKFHFYDKTAFTLLKKVIGLNRGRLFPVAGAPLADHMTEFLLSVNIPICYGYGLTETSATVCCYPSAENFTIGSIGVVMPDIEVRIDERNNEILVKGKTITPGYYKKPEETAKVFTEDGFFRTGDAGHLEGNTLYFLERIKDLFKTSNGKYIAPQAIELSLSGNAYIEQCVVIADTYKFVSALIVPDFENLENYARKRDIPYENRQELTDKKEIMRFYQSIIEECQKKFASYEKIKRFTLLAEPFSMAKGEITDTLKLRRRVIARNYAEQIKEMYRE
ncbi:MAG: long-chain fatty acid--CoA ligase [Tannerella sp.]|jgi:long-chain acyl-CoA synthetase|nr:long-chain fatty acid--CoA ligase [Tannerella sp.]